MVYSAKQAWINFRSRCTNKKHADYPRYGGRGISYDPRWDIYTNFLQDMGEPPKGTTLDRINNDGPYCKENCKWSTPKEQARNRRSTCRVTAFGKTQSIMDWAEETGLGFFVIWNRLKDGWNPDQALSIPVAPRKPRLDYVWKGKSWKLSELAKETGVSADAIAKRIKAGMSMDEALSLPYSYVAKPRKGKT